MTLTRWFIASNHDTGLIVVVTPSRHELATLDDIGAAARRLAAGEQINITTPHDVDMAAILNALEAVQQFTGRSLRIEAHGQHITISRKPSKRTKGVKRHAA